jgi:hypothetical protein
MGCEPDHNESHPSGIVPLAAFLLSTPSEAHMRKHTIFAIAATMLVLAATFWVKSGVLANKTDLSYSAAAGSFLPVRTLDPAC